ncbi:MAG: hypothetical protein D6816_02695 [Bacteroidetes bacterium]|nr:MAG: hypothetical protein D6816_02695 [Bacteroidota bacterium]
MEEKALIRVDPIYSGRPDDPNAPTITDLHEARTRWGTMALSAILTCASDKKVGLRKFLELADTTQRELVGGVAKDFYAKELGLTEDTLETFLTVTNLGITGCGFDNEVLAEESERRVVIEATTCPIVHHANLAGFQNGDPAMDDLSLWCDTYDNFESAAVSPSQGLIHSHCLGKGDKYCRIICVTLDEDDRRKDGEHIFDYTARLRKKQQEYKPDGPWVLDDKPPELVQDLIRDFVSGSIEIQEKIAPTLYERRQIGAMVWGRIGAVSTLMAGKLLGWDTLIDSIPDKLGVALKKAAKQKAQSLGIQGDSARDAATLHLNLIKGQGFGEYEIEEESPNRVKASCDKCPIIEWGREAGLEDEEIHIADWCSAARTQEAKVISSSLTHTYTGCLGRGDSKCSWVIEKS